jgi:eukaryotic-like serine/threonine-protein kinase
MSRLDPDRWEAISLYLDQALHLPEGARPAWLAALRDQNPTLAADLSVVLLGHHSLSERFVGHGDPITAPTVATATPTHWIPGTPVGPARSRSFEDDFAGTDRFAAIRRLGAGGMGMVYEVHDQVRHEVVALKTLRRTTPAGIYRLKQEFRSLAGMTHTNVVSLYELFVEDSRCFFTMELVRGVTFVDYVRQGSGAVRVARLTAAWQQLIAGVSALHRFGKLHRDIKPSNVLVTPEGRVVILDFGLITPLFPDSLGGHEPVAGGTPAYLPPEEGSGLPPSEAGDWYSVGATVYAALTGHAPFKGTLVDVLLRKNLLDPPSPAEIASDVPADLSDICMEMMCRDPARRLSGRDALIRLGGAAGVFTPDAVPDSHGDALFVGRTRELALLDEAFRTVVSGLAAAVYVCGPSGIGKSALVRSFVARLSQTEEVLVLAGRCYEHESVPYKALDGVVDSLCQYLLSLPPSAAESLMPRDVAALPRLFPAMQRVPAIARARLDREPSATEPLVLRRLAFEALRELLARLAARARVVIYIDDLQWSDVDGALLLEELVRQPAAPAMLTVVSFRSEEVGSQRFLQRLIERRRHPWVSVSLEPLPDAEALELIQALAGAPLSEDQRQRITSEAGGNPFFLEQLARYAVTQNASADRRPTFAAMFETRVRGLPDAARRFLHTLVVCGRPMTPELVAAASGLARDTRSLVAGLRTAHFIRSSGSSERVEAYHDRIREALTAQLLPHERRRIHALVADTLVGHGIDDAEALFEHYRGADDRERASVQAARAAERAAAALAFDRAALFYSHALDLAPTSQAAPEWKEGQARALANAGRPAEAAEAYLRAVPGAGPGKRVELQRRAAEQFLIGGHIDRGLDLIRTVMAGVGVGVPRSPRGAIMSMLWQRARLRWRGIGFVARTVDEIDAGVLLRVDTCWSAVTGLLLVDMLNAGYYSARHLLLALDAGEPSRIARAMAIEATSRRAYPTGRRLTETLFQQSKALAMSVGNPHAMALSILGESITAMARGEWKQGGTLAEQALGIMRQERTGVTWEVNIAQNMAIWALLYRGELGEVVQRVPPLLASARNTGNLYIATELCTRSNYAWLAVDDPDEGEREAIESIERWSHKGFHRQHYSALLARVQTALYRGNGAEAWRLFTEHEPSLRRSLMTRLQVLRVETHYMRARSALAMAATNRAAHRFVSIARAEARRIARERMPWSDPIALLLRAGVAYLEGDAALSLKHLHDAVDGFERADMNLYAAVARLRIGELQRDAAGREQQEAAAAWMVSQHIKNPAGFTRMLAPGFPDAS